MSNANEAELIRVLERASALLLEQQRVLKTICQEFQALSAAATPLMLTCTDPDMLTTFHAELTRINAAVTRAAEMASGRLH